MSDFTLPPLHAFNRTAVAGWDPDAWEEFTNE